MKRKIYGSVGQLFVVLPKLNKLVGKFSSPPCITASQTTSNVKMGLTYIPQRKNVINHIVISQTNKI